MKPTPWFPIDTPPARPGRYEVLDLRTRRPGSYWQFEGVDSAGNAIWFPESTSMLVMQLSDLVWRGVTDELWTQANGEQVPVFMMHEEHVKNVLRMLMGKARARNEKFAAAKAHFRLSPDCTDFC